jgi:hypothetical protein
MERKNRLARRKTLKVGHVRFDEKKATGLQVIRDVAEARDLRGLRGQVENRVEDEVRDGEGPIDGGSGEVTDRNVNLVTARFLAQFRNHRL